MGYFGSDKRFGGVWGDGSSGRIETNGVLSSAILFLRCGRWKRQRGKR